MRQLFEALFQAVDLLVSAVQSRAAGEQFEAQVLVFAAEELRLLLPPLVLLELSTVHGRVKATAKSENARRGKSERR